MPCAFRPQQKEILPGKAIAAQVQTRTDQFWVLSVYCHPQTVRTDCETISQWLHAHCLGDDPCFLLGDFNQGDALFPDIWQRITEAVQGEDIVGDQPTFWGPNGSSSLDRVVLPMEYMNRGLIQCQAYYDRFFDSSGHASITIKLSHRPPVISSSDLPTHMTIPACVFQPGKDQHDSRKVWTSLQSLIRRLALIAHPTFESLQTAIWQWWMSLPQRPRDFNILRKYLQAEQPVLNLPKRLVDELIAALPGFTPTLAEFCQSPTTITVPRTFLWKCFELLDLQIQQQHIITRNRDEINRGRGLGTSAPLWKRLRASCWVLSSIMARSLMARVTSAAPTWNFQRPCLRLANSGLNHQWLTTLSGPRTWRSTNSRSPPGLISFHRHEKI